MGWRLRWRVMTSPSMRAKFAEERVKLGLPPQNHEGQTFHDVWNDEEKKQELLAVQSQEWERLREKARRYEEHWMKGDPNLKDERSRVDFENRWTLASLAGRNPDSVQTPPLPSVRR